MDRFRQIETFVKVAEAGQSGCGGAGGRGVAGNFGAVY